MSSGLEGLESLQENFNKVLKGMDKINNEGFTDVVLDLLGKSVELAPVDLGDLRGSGNATVNSTKIAVGTKEGNLNTVGSFTNEDVLNGTVGFNEQYAVKQHEHTEYQHHQGGQAKYLEQPFRENVQKYINHIAEANKKFLE
jgi:hypothetical protein